MLRTLPVPSALSLDVAVARRPWTAFALFAVVHAAVWTALPGVLYRNLPLDLIEALTYGREWQIGYDKLPPLPWWLVEIAHRVVGHDVAYYALAQLAVLGALAAVFATARPLVGAAGALVAVLIVDGVHYFNYTSPKFNHDVVQLPLWALAGFAYHRALRGKALWPWLVLGLAVGAALWAKYFVVVLAAPLVLFMLLDPRARRTFRTPGPYVALVAAGLVMAPHLVWLVQNDFLPLAYAESRAAPAQGIFDHVLNPLQFALAQTLFLVPALPIAAPLWLRRTQAAVPAAADAYDRRIVTLLAFGPLATMLVLSAVTGRGTVAMWGYPLFLFLGLWVVMIAHTALGGRRLLWIGLAWGFVLVAYAITFVVNYAVLPLYHDRYIAVLYPGDRLAAEIESRFRAATGRDLAYVIADMWDGGNVAHYAPSHPRVLIDGLPRRAPWIDLADLRRRGAVVVWTLGDTTTIPEAYQDIAPGAQAEPPFTLPFRFGGRTLEVGWAILRPQK